MGTAGGEPEQTPLKVEKPSIPPQKPSMPPPIARAPKRAAKKSKSSCVSPPRVNDVLQYWLSASPSTKSKQRCAQDAVEIGVLQYCTDGSVYSSRLDAGNIETIGTVISVYFKKLLC